MKKRWLAGDYPRCSKPAVRSARVLRGRWRTTTAGEASRRVSIKLESFLADQAYRLCHWRVATDEINYRRFFDVNMLAAIRVEDPEVFAAIHELVFRFIEQGWVSGLRIDHVDGLQDPAAISDEFGRGDSRHPQDTGHRGSVCEGNVLHRGRKNPAHDESLPPEWPCRGTTGYDFLNLLNGLFVDRNGVYALRDAYSRLTGSSETFPQVLYQSKLAILATSLSSEFNVLSHQLDQISEQHRWSRDFTRLSLHRTLRELVACFPVYRTYIRADTDVVRDEDRRRILSAVRLAKRRNPAMSTSYFDFIASVLLLEDPQGLSEDSRQARRRFVLKLQQVTGPVTAKGLEDTAFYRFYPLASLNEVGADPMIPGTSVEQFHRRIRDRMNYLPHELSATGTHDTKRGEDRARLNVLSEIPGAWEAAVRRWQAINAPARCELDGAAVPDSNEEYLIYQTLVGTWPVCPVKAPARQAYTERIVHYLDKALREAKLHTSWLNPYQEYDQAVADFIRAILADVCGPFVYRSERIRAFDRERWFCQFAGPNPGQDLRAWSARFLSGGRMLGLQPGGSRQSPAGRLCAAAAHARRVRIARSGRASWIGRPSLAKLARRSPQDVRYLEGPAVSPGAH